jgi:hypothetical protein
VFFGSFLTLGCYDRDRKDLFCMAKTPRGTISTFVIRFWREGTDRGPRWRGRIEHVQSGEGSAFLELDEMLRFLRRYGIAIGDVHPAQDGSRRSG